MPDDVRLYMFECGTLKCHVENIKMNQGLGDEYEIPVPWYLITHPKGLATIVYWPRDADEGGPFGIMHRLLAESIALERAWQGELEASAHAASARVREDVRIAFEMQHDDAHSVWQALTRLGPLRSLSLTRGQAFVDQLGTRFEAECPKGPLSHTPEARLLLIERDG